MRINKISILSVLLVCTAQGWGTTTNFIVTPELAARRAVSPLLCGGVLDVGQAAEVAGLWSEMLFNRSFEPFSPYKVSTLEAADLWLEPKDPAKGYNTEWFKEPWFHSGYEHNPWFAAPGNGGPVPIDDKAAFMIASTPLAKVDLRRQSEGTGHGRQELRVRNQETTKWAGIAQAGKFLRKGETYRFRGKLRAIGNPVRPEIRFYAENDWTKPIATVALGKVGLEWEQQTARIPNENFQGRATFALWLPPGSEVAVDDFSLMPANNVGGWRRDSVAALRRVAPAILKFPGGPTASFYDWREGIGERSKRVPEPSPAWGGINYNDVGVAECVTLCREVDAEALWCVNVFHPAKAQYDWFWGESGPAPTKHGLDFQKFSDLEQGAREAADLVAYCNKGVGAHPLADLRAQHGFPRPFNIRYWELDNEAYRWFEPEEYAQAAVIYAKAMKAVDPRIQIGMSVYGSRLQADGRERIVFQDAIPQMLAIAGKHIDFLADRAVADKAYLTRIANILDLYNTENRTSIRYADTGKVFYEPQATAPGYPEISSWRKSALGGTWFSGMKVLKDYITYQRAGGDVQSVFFFGVDDNFGQSLINTPKDSAFVTASGLALSVMAKSPLAWPLRFDGYEPESAADFQVAAGWDKEKRNLVLYVYNRTGARRSATFEYDRLERRFTQVEFTRVWSASPLDQNTKERPLTIRHEVRLEPVSRQGTIVTVEAEPWSFTQAVLR